MAVHLRRLVLVIALVVVAACSPPGSRDDGSLVVYSNSLSDGRSEWLVDQAKDAGFTLRLVDLGGSEITNRLLAERNAPVADVVFGLNDIYFQDLASAKILRSYTPRWADRVDAALVGADAMFWPILREPIMLVYDDAAFSSADPPPADWPDLWRRADLRDRYEVPTDLGGATTQLVIAGILARHLDPDGELEVSDEGWREIADYFERGNPAQEGRTLYARMAAGDVVAGQMWLAGKASMEVEHGVRSTAVQPAVGVPMAVQHVAVVAGSGSDETAEEFVDWFGSGEVQAGWSREFFTAPTNEDAVPDADQEAVEMTDSFTAQDIDWALVSRNLDAWIEKIELEYL